MPAQKEYLSVLLLRGYVRRGLPARAASRTTLRKLVRNALTASLCEKLYRQQLTLSKPSR